jgi:hypothetical protein
MPAKKIEATEKLRGKESKWRAKKFTAQNFKGCKNLKGEIKKKGAILAPLPFFEQVENFFESIK